MARLGGGGLVGILLLAVLIGGCNGEPGPTTLSVGDEDATSGDATTTTDVVALTNAPEATSPAGNTSEPTIPSGFPVPICGISSGPCEGATVNSAFPTEVVVIYPESEYEALIDYYQAISDANGGTQFDLFPGGSEWDIQGIQIRVTPVDPVTQPQLPPGIQLFVRLAP